MTGKKGPRYHDPTAEADPVAAACDWFRRTGHCHGCDQPGTYCQCVEAAPCGCRGLHPMGSGLAADAVETFADPVGEQAPLFGGGS